MSILAHRKRRHKEEASHNRVKHLNRGFKLRRKNSTFKKPEFFINQFRMAERDTRRIRRHVYSNKLFNGPETDEPKLLVVTHHRARKVASPECKKILQKLNLFRLHSTVLVRNDTETRALLKLVEPYVIFGYPNIQTVRDLIFKHGFLRIDKKKTPMTSNKLIEDHLGEHGIICIEDIVHALFTVSENFDVLQRYLLPFNVSIINELILLR